MYSTILTAQLQSGKTEEAVRILQEKIAPALKDQQGFRAACLVGDPRTDEVVYITFWDTEADITAMDTRGIYHQSVAQFVQLFAAPPTREKYAVLFMVDNPGG